MTGGIGLPEVHRLKNQLSIVLGFCELLLAEMPPGSQHRDDVVQIQKAGQSALEILRVPEGDDSSYLPGRGE